MNVCEVIDNTNSSIESESRMEYNKICKEIDNFSYLGAYSLMHDFQSPEVKYRVKDMLVENGFVCMDIYERSIVVCWDIKVLRTAYYAYQRYKDTHDVVNAVCCDNCSTIQLNNVNNAKK